MVVTGIKTLFRQTVSVFMTITVLVGVLYTLIRKTETIVLSMFTPADRFYSILNLISETEYALWGVIGVALLFSLVIAVLFMGERAARFVNNDSIQDEDIFGFRK